ERRVERFRRGRPPPAIQGRTVIVVDDGIATGSTVRAVLRGVRRCGPKRLILAVPVAATDALESLRAEVDEVVCLEASNRLGAIGSFYDDFRQATDEDVIARLERARKAPTEAAAHG